MFTETIPDPADRIVAPAAAPRTFSAGYIAAWSAIAMLSAGYIGYAALTSTQTATVAASGAAPAASQTAADDAERLALRQALVSLQGDLDGVRADLARTAGDPTLFARLTAIEERSAALTGIAVARVEPPMKAMETQAAPVVPAAQPLAIGSPLTAAITHAASATDAAAANVAKPASRLGSAIETGSLAPASAKSAATATKAPAISPPPAPATPGDITFGEPVVKAAPKPYGVQLGSGASLDQIRLSWSLLAEQHGEALHNLQPRYTASGTPEAGLTYDLLAGPVKTAADAKRICKALAARGTDCKVTPFAGETF